MIHKGTLNWAITEIETKTLFQVLYMAVPKRKHSNSRSGKRRAGDGLKAKPLTLCPKCSTTTPTHVVCPTCGYYMGRVVSPAKEEIDV